MDIETLKRIIDEEHAKACERILRRFMEENSAHEVGEEEENEHASVLPEVPQLVKLPPNENYQRALELYQEGSTHSNVSRELGVSMGSVKRYYNWLVINGYLEAEPEELSAMEQEVVTRLYQRGMSLGETARELDISIPNVTQRRNNALRKGYNPSEDRG